MSENNKILKNNFYSYSLKEEVIHCIIHGVGMILFAIGGGGLVSMAFFFGSLSHVLSYSIYSCSLILLYAMSTAYHAVTHVNAKKILKICDHISIYFLIAGSYTPFLVLNYNNKIGNILLGFIWTLAFIGVFFKLFYTGRFTRISTIIYLLMGWLIVVTAKILIISVSYIGVFLILAGGLSYSFGTIFYLRKSMKYHHAIWHLFVLIGSVFHFLAVLLSTNLNFPKELF